MLIQVFVVNQDLKMRAGKIAGQVCHAETLYMEKINRSLVPDNTRPRYEDYIKWRECDVKPIGVMTKIVKKATSIEINDIIKILDKRGIHYYIVYDLGKTQVEKGSLTCVVTEPIEEGVAVEIFGKLKLL